MTIYPAPRPKVRPKKPRKELRSRTPLKSSGRIKPKKQKPSEFARIYGSRARVRFVNSLPCVYPKCWRPSDNHHIEGGGVGRKADYTTIVPLCRAHHRGIHVWGQRTWERFTGVDLAAAAEATERAWQKFGAADSLLDTREDQE